MLVKYMIGKSLHSLMYIIGTAAMVIVSLCVRKRLGLKIWNSLLFTVVAFLSDCLGAFLMGKVYTAVVASLGGDGVSNYAIYGALIFTPVFMITAAIAMKQPWRKVIDMLAPGIFIILTLTSLTISLTRMRVLLPTDLSHSSRRLQHSSRELLIGSKIFLTDKVK